MRQKMHKPWSVGTILLIGIVVVMGLLWWLGNKPQTGSQANPMTVQHQMIIGATSLQVEVRRTEAEKELGLSWRKVLGENEGMAFVYDQPQQVLYWMKGMNFPLDFIWVTHGQVVDLTQNVAPPTTANPAIITVSPNQDVDTVIEVNAGYISKHHVHVGDVATLTP